ncbi:MAG: general secretion pathway protein GspK [Synergistaceae bacterium]|jgi:type II secretory pathway component PulK|nr:general secretion pathway protein GspK [Synergistaceae bacterium]
MSVPCRSSRGFILITVLFMSTLILSAAASLAWFARLQMRRVSGEEFAMVSRSLVEVSCLTVAGWIAGDGNEFDSAFELLYSDKIPLMLSFNEWDVFIKITPLDRLLPINGIFLPDGVTIKSEYEYPWQEIWARLGEVQTAVTLLDFLDRNTEARPGGREDDYFLNRGICHMSELLYLPEITPRMLYGEVASADAIDTFFSVYCEDKININFAPANVLSVLDAQINQGVVSSILMFRQDASITSMKDLIKVPGFPLSATAKLENIIGYRSSYFSVDMKVEHGDEERNFNIVLKRSGNTCQIINWRE